MVNSAGAGVLLLRAKHTMHTDAKHKQDADVEMSAPPPSRDFISIG